MRRGNSFLYSLCALAAISATSVGVLADAYVQVGIEGFSPSVVNIAPGEAVYWIVGDDWGPYSISSEAGAWGPQYLYDQGDITGLVFNQVGDYAYYDAFNFNFGVVHVRTGMRNAPPIVSISSPADGTVFRALATFQFTALATDLDNGVSDVEFYIASEFVDDIFSSPFSATVAALGPGAYTLQVIAYDLAGASSTSSISITVLDTAASGITLGRPSLAAGQFRFDVSGLSVGKQVVLEVSADLGTSAVWKPVQTNLVSSAFTSFTSKVVPGCQFFRAVQLR